MIKLENIPHDPGCYLFKDKEGTIIYVGKAKDLKKRVSNYFSKIAHDEKTEALIREIHDAEFFITTSEVEALVLENNLIKKHRPHYNINLKDSQRYAYIVITDERFPRLLTARDKKLPGKYFGPFVSGEMRLHVLNILRNNFQIRTCTRMPKRACLRYHLGLCTAPCIGNISEEEYAETIHAVEHYLKGNADDLIKKLKIEMKENAVVQRYEKAKLLRDQINALEGLQERQNFEKDKKYDEDIINYIISGKTIYLILFHVSKGMLTTKKEFSFEATEEFLDAFLVQYYAENPVPKEIILPEPIRDPSLYSYLEKMRDGKVTIIIPQKGDKAVLLDLVKRNIEISFLAESHMINALRTELKLNSNPNIIECFDISNIQGSLSVGAMVQFRNAKPDKSNYRRFRIRTVVGTDDFASIKEIVRRRYYKIKIENGELPDLIVIDGGAGQLHAAIEALQEHGIRVPIIGLAKKFEEIYIPGMRIPIRLKKESKALKLLVQIRDEAHRFAIKYHRLLRSKEMVK
jgi:excinuclease ABC subunit C